MVVAYFKPTIRFCQNKTGYLSIFKGINLRDKIIYCLWYQVCRLKKHKNFRINSAPATNLII